MVAAETYNHGNRSLARWNLAAAAASTPTPRYQETPRRRRVGVVVVASLWGAREGAYGADGAEGTFRETPTAANRHLPSVELRGGGCA